MNHSPRPRLLAAVALGSAIMGAAHVAAHAYRAHRYALGAYEEQHQRLLAAMAENLGLRECWAPFEKVDPATQTQRTHLHGWVSLWIFGYRTKAVSLAEIRTHAKSLFATESGRRFWVWARACSLDRGQSGAALRVHEALDDAYATATGTFPGDL
ncbi:DUF6082 family protein [Streptomyces sp. NPDC087440]|uniref:DUF6082 family protein n=1 Tax=Streptomyces sp. NPDC087440 TaxID=3365790 RepID=UPI00380D86FD